MAFKQLSYDLKEQWADVHGYEGLYRVSSDGRVERLALTVGRGKGKYLLPASILANRDSAGYNKVTLYKNKKRKHYKVHQLVAMAFLGHKPDGFKIVVDHIDNNKRNNHVNNLQLLTNRQNTTKNARGVSKYVGVSRSEKSIKKWQSAIIVNKKPLSLGTFKTEIRASIAYQLALFQLDKLKALL